jgi:hypothetical protein
MPGDSRRAYARLDHRADVTILAGDRTVLGECRNISQGGMFIETAEPLSMDETVRVRFSLPDLKGAEVDTQATVRWVERSPTGRQGIGIQFSGLRPIEVWAVNQLFRRASKAD